MPINKMINRPRDLLVRCLSGLEIIAGAMKGGRSSSGGPLGTVADDIREL